VTEGKKERKKDNTRQVTLGREGGGKKEKKKKKKKEGSPFQRVQAFTFQRERKKSECW
jgi:hypothetical protein